MKRILFISMLLLLSSSYCALWAVQAARTTFTGQTTTGKTITVQLVGDEFYHAFVDSLGQYYQRLADGRYQAIEQQEVAQRRLRASQKVEMSKRLKVGAASMSKRLIDKMPASQSDSLSPRGLVILVNFSDLSFRASNTAAVMDSMLNGQSYTYDRSIGSAAQYFSDQSLGQYRPHFDVVGPVTLPHTMAHYGANDDNGDDLLPGDFVLHACSIASTLPGVDFNNYDQDQDGWLDFVYLIYAGYAEAESSEEDELWPISWTIPGAIYYGKCSLTDNMDTAQYTFNGKTIGSFAYSQELNFAASYWEQRGFSMTNPKRQGIGTFCHEFSHVLGLMDYYDTKYGYNYDNDLTPGCWSLMDNGNYNMGGDVPPNYSVYDRFALGWTTPTLLLDSQVVSLPYTNLSGYCITLNDSMPTPYDETATYYIENRQAQGWDAPIEAHGMLIWEVRYDWYLWYYDQVNVNDDDLHMRLISAVEDATYYEYKPFPGEQQVRSYSNIPDHYISQITEQDSVISFMYTSTLIPEDPDLPGEQPQAIDDINSSDSAPRKVIRDGQLFILSGDEVYSILGIKQE